MPPVFATAAQAVQWLRQRLPPAARQAARLCGNSAQVQPGDVFFAWPGAAADGRCHVHAALAAGAAAVLVEAQGVEKWAFSPALPIAAVMHLKAASGPIADLWLGQPSAELAVLAVTGTNGKTSTAWWLAHALAPLSLGQRRGCAFAGTLGRGLPGALEHSCATLTTPEALALQSALRQWADAGLAACALEASSIGLAEQRLAGTRIRAALFTNCTQDHLDYHASMQNYWQAKAALFDWPGLQTAILNIDDARGALLHRQLQNRAACALDIWSVSTQGPARLHARDIAANADGSALDCTVVEGDSSVRLHTHLIGRYNIGNLLGVMAALRTLGLDLAQAAAACRALPPVPGRMEIILPTSPAGHNAAACPLVVVDYAHTPDALQNALAALRPLAARRGGQLHCVFGCGGGRDASKRAPMGQIAQQNADAITLTSDNPRNEAPETIIEHIRAGVHANAPVQIQPDRARAIAQTIAAAGAADVVLIAGKGHETYQEIAGQRLLFCDAQQARSALACRA